jgi:beta-glucanase (GH16 family)
MPTGNIPGWNEVFADDFTGNSVGGQWMKYWGVPGGDSGGFFDPAHDSVSNGELTISGYQDAADDAYDAGASTYVTGGVSTLHAFSQTYGKYLVRFRMDAGQGVAFAIMLWPETNTWPPEIDFAEDNGSDRQMNTATLHYGADNTQVERTVGVNLTQWHTMGVEWTSDKLVYTLDGHPWATVDSPNVPDVPMEFAIQTQGWACGLSNWEQCPNSSTPSVVGLHVDWVVAYAPTS